MGHRGMARLGSPLLLAAVQAKMQGEQSHSHGETSSAPIWRGRNVDKGVRRQAETGETVGGGGKGKFKT